MVQHVERSRPPGRNDPCPCGSGKKYKRCCLVHELHVQPERHLDDVVTDVFAADEVGDVDAAIAILEEARSALHGGDIDSMLVERYMELPPDEAEPRLRRWWEQEHDRFSGAGLARFLVDRDRKEEALEVLAESKGTDAWPEYWSLLAALRDEQGDTAAAVAAMELYVRLVTESVDAWIMLADMQERAGMADRALMSLRRAGDLAPEQLLPRMLRLRILAQCTRWREARDLAEALLEGHYEDSTTDLQYDLRRILAQAYWILGNVDGARRLWGDLLAERPGDADARYGLANLELSTRRYRRVLLVLDAARPQDVGLGMLELRLRALLALHEYEEAERTAHAIAELDEAASPVGLVRAAQAAAEGEHVWSLTLLDEDPPEPYLDLWLNLRLDCLVRAGRWNDISPLLKAITQPDDTVFTNAALCALASGKLDLVERIVEKIDDQQCAGTRALVSLIGPLRQTRRAAEVRRQQQVDQAEKQRWTAENRDLRRRVRDLERHNAGLAESLARAEAALERFFETAGGITEGALPGNWEAQVQEIVERAHKDAQAQEFQGAEQRVRQMVGDACWARLSESVRASLREGEWLFTAVEGEDRDYGAALLEYARGLESAFKEAIFARARAYWQRRPGPVDRLEDEGHDPSLGPFVRYVLRGGHLTLGSMAAALERMADVRRQGFAVTLLRRQLEIEPYDEWALATWKRVAERLATAADARNQPAHAAAVSRDDARAFRDLVVGTDGLLRSLDLSG